MKTRHPLQAPKYQPKIPISVCVIAKNEAKNLPGFHRSIQAILGHPEDELLLLDTGSTDATCKEARKRGWSVHRWPDACSLDLEALGEKYLGDQTDWHKYIKHGHFKDGLISSFAEARQRSFDKARNAVCFWLDLDDVIVNPEPLREYIDVVFAEDRHGAIMLNYQYAHGEDGKCTTELWRERIVTRDHFEWKGACHETLIPREDAPTDLVIARKVDCPTQIYHKHPKEHQFSDVRNYLILHHDLDTREWRDPRTLFYLGNAARGLGMYTTALRWYTEFVGCSGNKDDVLSSWLSMCGCLNALGRHYKAVQACEEALRVAPDDARVYYFMADAWFRLGDYEKCLALVRAGDAFPRRDTFHAVDPNTFNFHPKAIAAHAARELRNPDLAMAFAEQAMQERPDLPIVQRAYEDMRHWAGATQLGMMVAEVLKRSPNPELAMPYMPISPHMRAWGFGVPEDVISYVVPAGKRDVVFYCGHTAEPWGPHTGKTGSGASEKMVVEMAKRLAKNPKLNVSVYCTLHCDEGDYDGVHWKHSANYNPHIYRDVLIIWRVPAILEQMPIRAGRIYVWMHDCGHDAYWTKPVISRLHKVIFLSKFQRSLHPSVPEEKVYYSRNGIDLERHLLVPSRLPKQKKIVFMSSPDRGWINAIRLFHQSGLQKKGWTLHMFYGFAKHWRRYASKQGFGHVVELNKETNLFAYEDKCYDLCDGQHVINRGRVAWDEMAKELHEAMIWLYPTRFDEISCVAAMEAMAAGCVCMTTDQAALKETLKGYPGWANLSEIKPENWGHYLRSVAQVDVSPQAEFWAEHAKRFDLDALAKSWTDELILFDMKEADDDADPEFVLNVTGGKVGTASPDANQTCTTQSVSDPKAGRPTPVKPVVDTTCAKKITKET